MSTVDAEAVNSSIRYTMWSVFAFTGAAPEDGRARAAEAAAESPLWGESLREDADHEPVFSPLVDERYALGLETIYEGYLLHYGRPRLFAPPDADVALLTGDYLYAHGLSRIAALGWRPTTRLPDGLRRTYAEAPFRG